MMFQKGHTHTAKPIHNDCESDIYTLFKTQYAIFILLYSIS